MKFDEIKRMAAWEIIKLLQKKTRRNANLIKENSRIIQSVLKGEIELSNGRFNVAEVQSKNNDLLKENSEYLKLHNQLLSFMRSMQDDTDAERIVEVENDFHFAEQAEGASSNENVGIGEAYVLTIEGKMDFNSHHPYFESDEFRNRLLEYYTEAEEYEKCALLVKK